MNERGNIKHLLSHRAHFSSHSQTMYGLVRNLTLSHKRSIRASAPKPKKYNKNVVAMVAALVILVVANAGVYMARKSDSKLRAAKDRTEFYETSSKR